MSKKKYNRANNRLNSSIIAFPIQDIELLTQKSKTLVKKYQCKKCQTVFNIDEPYCPECSRHGYNLLIFNEINVEV